MHVEQTELLAQALGVSIFQSDLYMPTYRAGRMGRWRLTHGGFGLDRGYYSGQWGVVGLPLLLREHQGQEQTWMSLSPHEIESQELGCRYAYGHTAVMGLGMGWVAINIALNPAVRRVTVIELDPEVVELFAQSQALEGLPEDICNKLHIVQADALEWQPDQPVDFLYADIWRCLEEPQTLDEVRRMQAHVQAQTIYFWGQELAIYALAEACLQNVVEATARKQIIQDCVTQTIGLPLLLPQDFDYAQRIIDVVQLRRIHRPAPMPDAKPSISLRPIGDDDQAFLFELYASTRSEEARLFPMNAEQWQIFLHNQYQLQHTQYQQNYPAATFNLVCLGGVPIGQLYVDRSPGKIHIIEISLLPQYQRQGVGATLLQELQREADSAGATMTLRVQKTNSALDFYHKLGFEIGQDEMIFWQMFRAPLQGTRH